MIIKQVSVFVENRVGTLQEIMSLLASHDINLRAMSIADTADFGVLRLICDDPFRAQKLLEAEKCIVTINEVLGVALPDRPGTLEHVLKILADNGYGLEYVYAFITHNEENAYIILRIEEVEDNEKAEALLRANNIIVLNTSDVCQDSAE